MTGSLKKRKGKCKECGKCCKGCEYLTPNNLCAIYDHRPWWCRTSFPVCKEDILLKEMSNCGYYWEDEKKKLK